MSMFRNYWDWHPEFAERNPRILFNRGFSAVQGLAIEQLIGY